MLSGRRFPISMVIMLVTCAGVMAQNDSESAPTTVGGFQNQGSVSVGYRFADIKGYQPQYLQLFDLQKGLRLQDFNIFGEAKPDANLFADTYSLSMSGLGGDPFPTAQLKVAKNKLYDFRVNWRQSYYYWNENDNVVLPLGLPGLTNNHDWATVRKFGSADLTLHATDNLRFNFNYYRTTDTGTVFTTRAPDFFGAPGYWGSFVRANPYYLDAPINDEANRFTGGLDYTYHSWSVHYRLGYQTFSENVHLNNVSSPELSIDTGTPITAQEPLLSLSWSQFRRLSTPISEFSYVGKPLPKFEWRGGYLYYRYQGPAALDQSFNGIAPDASGTLVPYAVSENARVNVTEPNHIVTQGFTYQIKDWWSVNLDVRYSRFSSDGVGNFGSLFDASAPASGQTDLAWRNSISDLHLDMDLTPMGTLVIRPGIHLMKSDIEAFEDGASDPPRTLRVKTASPEISIAYEPSKMFSIRGDLHSFTNGASYTAITPHTQVGGRAVIQFHPIPKLSLDDELSISNSKLIDANFRNNVHANAITLSYAMNERFSIFAGFTYSSFYAAGDVQYVRGTKPLSDFLTDQEANRVWQAGVDAKPVKGFGMRLSGNYDRSTGLAVISGEPPAYGPLTWPLVTGTVYYDFPKAGRFSIDLQRTYYIEQIVTANNFSANLLTIRWTRDF